MFVVRWQAVLGVVMSLRVP